MSAQFRTRLHACGMRVTPQKLAVFHQLQRKNYHPTPDMVFAALRVKFPMVGLGTVYQILDQLSSIGVVRKISSTDNRQRFDGKLDPHAHFVCEACGRIEDIEGDFIDTFRERFSREYDFHIRNHYFEFSGLCSRCVSGRG